MSNHHQLYETLTKGVQMLLYAIILIIGIFASYVVLGSMVLSAGITQISYPFLSEDDPILTGTKFVVGVLLMVSSVIAVLRAKISPHQPDMRIALFAGITGFAFGFAVVLSSIRPF